MRKIKTRLPFKVCLIGQSEILRKLPFCRHRPLRVKPFRIRYGQSAFKQQVQQMHMLDYVDLRSVDKTHQIFR